MSYLGPGSGKCSDVQATPSCLQPFLLGLHCPQSALIVDMTSCSISTTEVSEDMFTRCSCPICVLGESVQCNELVLRILPWLNQKKNFLHQSITLPAKSARHPKSDSGLHTSVPTPQHHPSCRSPSRPRYLNTSRGSPRFSEWNPFGFG
jgi:hypothetical protein